MAPAEEVVTETPCQEVQELAEHSPAVFPVPVAEVLPVHELTSGILPFVVARTASKPPDEIVYELLPHTLRVILAHGLKEHIYSHVLAILGRHRREELLFCHGRRIPPHAAVGRLPQLSIEVLAVLYQLGFVETVHVIAEPCIYHLRSGCRKSLALRIARYQRAAYSAYELLILRRVVQIVELRLQDLGIDDVGVDVLHLAVPVQTILPVTQLVVDDNGNVGSRRTGRDGKIDVALRYHPAAYLKRYVHGFRRRTVIVKRQVAIR